MNTTVFIGMLALLQLICLWAGKRASKNLNNQEDYFLAGKEVRLFPLMMTFIATQIGGGLVLGAAEEAYQFGWTVLLYPLGACLGFVVLALGVGKKLAKFEVSTVAELLEVAYGSALLKRAASVLSIISLFMILIAQVIASRKFMVSLGVDYSVLFLLFWAIVILYTSMGGLKAVVSIDIVQALFFIAVFSFGFAYILLTGSFSLDAVVQSGWSGDQFALNLSKMSGWLLMPLLFMVIEQDMAQRCFAARSPKIVSRATAYAALCTLAICTIPVFLGILGKQMEIPIPAGSSVFMVVASALTNPILGACLGCAVLMAILSTAISLLNAVSSNLAQDFEFTRSEKKGVRRARYITSGIGFLAVGGSFFAGSIVDLLIQSYELSVYCLFIPVAAALFKTRGHSLSAWMAVIFGGIGFGFTRFISPEIPKEFFCIFLSALGYGLGEGWIAWKARSSKKGFAA